MATPAFGQVIPGARLAAPYCHEGPRWRRASLSFAGTRRVLLLIHDSEIAEPRPRPVSLGAPIVWNPDPNSRTGGVGSLDGEQGVFSGRRHISAPQLFRPWPSVVRETVLDIFNESRSAPGHGAPADDPATWTVIVSGAQMRVVSVHRKTLPVHSARIDPRTFASARRHLVTLHLDGDIPPEAWVTIRAPGLDDLRGTPGDAQRSELVHVCQAGYPLAGTKKAYVGLWFGADANGSVGNSDALLSPDQAWRLIDTKSGEAMAEGGLVLAKAGDEEHFDKINFNGCDIYEADFSAVRRQGSYRLEVEGVGSSYPFPIAATPYAEVLRLAARWYYNQRSGCEIKAPHGEGRTRPRNGHPADGLMVWQTEVQLGRTSEGFSREPSALEILSKQPAEDETGAVPNPSAWGGWHDAGDWDRRAQHLEVVWLMAHLVENYEAARKLDMNIPESGRAFADPLIDARKGADDRGDGTTVLPDLVHEALWGISLWRRTQTPEGGIIGGVEYSSDGITGSVSWNPIQRAYAYAPEEWPAYFFVMAAAKLGHVIETVCGDATLGAALKAEAEAAWAWAEAERLAGSAAGDKNAESNVRRARMRAAASLYRATGNPEAREIFEVDNVFAPTGGEQDEPPARAVVAHVSLDYVRAG
ncbi:MAG: glycoside hydrolase family 9 protein, partial [Paracoccaceae bacterium]|nr:glycoside hydrolase family 9 protein [Paracoccaceae bacterium]